MPHDLTQPENVSILIEGKEFKGFADLEIENHLDSFSSCTFRAPFEPNDLNFRKTFVPFSYVPMQVLVDGNALFTGTLVGPDPERTASEASVTVTAYALPAVFEDCTASANTVPHEYAKLNLLGMTEQILAEFNISVTMLGDPGPPFERAKLKEGKKIKEFLVELASQVGHVMSNNEIGQLLYWKSVEPGNPVASISEDEQALVKIKAEFRPQEYYSEISGFTRTSRRRIGNKWTEKNPFLTTNLRPHCFKLDDLDKSDIVAATQFKMGKMLGNVCSYTIENLPTWRDPKGNLWRPNTTMKLFAPSAMCYVDYELVIRTVKLKQSAHSYTAELNCVLPGSFSGSIPSSLPWVQ